MVKDTWGRKNYSIVLLYSAYLKVEFLWKKMSTGFAWHCISSVVICFQLNTSILYAWRYYCIGDVYLRHVNRHYKDCSDTWNIEPVTYVIEEYVKKHNIKVVGIFVDYFVTMILKCYLQVLYAYLLKDKQVRSLLRLFIDTDFWRVWCKWSCESCIMSCCCEVFLKIFLLFENITQAWSFILTATATHNVFDI